MQIAKKIVVHLFTICILVVVNLYTVNERGEVIESVVQSTPYGLGLTKERPPLWELSSAAVNPLGLIESQVKGKNTSSLTTIMKEECEESIEYEFMNLKESQVKGRNTSALIDIMKEECQEFIEYKLVNLKESQVKRRNTSALMDIMKEEIEEEVEYEFTVPYCETGLSVFSKYTGFSKYDGVVMVVRKESGEANMWTFVKPFTPGMWWTTAAILIYTALVVWLLETKINPVVYTDMSITEVFIIIWSAVSTISLSQNVRIENRLARIVIAVWLLVMSIIVSSYTDNFNLRLNAQKTNPTITITSLHEFVPVGYLKHDHIKQDNLRKYLGIDQRNLIGYTTVLECAMALSEGPNNGGVAAVLIDSEDAHYFSGYTIYHILYPGSLPEAEMPNRLGIKDFLGWFIITGTVSTMALIIFFFNLLHGLWTDPDATGQGIEPLEMLPLNDDPEAQSSSEEESVETMGITNISDAEDNTLVEASSVHIPNITDESQSTEDQNI